MNCYQLLTETKYNIMFHIVAVINTYQWFIMHPPASQWSLLPAHRLNDSIPSSSVPKLSAPLDCMHAHWSVVVCHLQHQIPSSGYARQSLIAERKTWLIREEVSDPSVPGGSHVRSNISYQQ